MSSGDEGDDEDAPSASSGVAVGVPASDAAPAIADAPASSSTNVPDPPAPLPQFVRRRQRVSPQHAKGRLKQCATNPPQECRGDAAPTIMDDEGWMAISAADLSAADGCPVNKARRLPGRRRMTGGMQTFMLQCGIIVDFIELYKGESLQLVYAKLLILDARLVSSLLFWPRPPLFVVPFEAKES